MKAHIEIEVTIDFDHTPGAEQTRTDPACDAELQITSVRLGRLELADVLSQDIMSQLVEQCFEAVNSNEPEEQE